MARYGYDPLRPLNERQIHRRVRGQINPYLSSGRRAIQAYTEALARALSSGPAQSQAIYGRAQGEQAAVDQALANRLTGAGGAAQSDLAAQLQQAGQSQAPAQAVGQVGTGAANAGYASGSADLSRLIAQGAAAQNYAGVLPSLARLGGAQRSQQYEAQLLSQLPKLIQQEEDRNFQRAVAAQTGLLGTGRIAATERGQTLSYRARIKAARIAHAGKIDPKTGLPYSYESSMASIRATGARQGRAYDENLSRSAGHAVDHQGRPIINPKTGRAYKYVPKPKSKGTSKHKLHITR